MRQKAPMVTSRSSITFQLGNLGRVSTDLQRNAQWQVSIFARPSQVNIKMKMVKWYCRWSQSEAKSCMVTSRSSMTFQLGTEFGSCFDWSTKSNAQWQASVFVRPSRKPSWNDIMQSYIHMANLSSDVILSISQGIPLCMHDGINLNFLNITTVYCSWNQQINLNMLYGGAFFILLQCKILSNLL